MKQIESLLWTFLIILLTITLFKLGFRFIYLLFSYWYVTIPLIIAIYLLLTTKKKSRKRYSRTDLDPSKEIKLDKEPEIKDVYSTEDNDKTGGENR